MNVEIGTETTIFLFWEYLFQNFGILSLQCGCSSRCKSSATDLLCPVPRPHAVPTKRPSIPPSCARGAGLHSPSPGMRISQHSGRPAGAWTPPLCRSTNSCPPSTNSLPQWELTSFSPSCWIARKAVIAPWIHLRMWCFLPNEKHDTRWGNRVLCPFLNCFDKNGVRCCDYLMQTVCTSSPSYLADKVSWSQIQSPWLGVDSGIGLR